jgi:hypothetical protein
MGTEDSEDYQEMTSKDVADSEDLVFAAVVS